MKELNGAHVAAFVVVGFRASKTRTRGYEVTTAYKFRRRVHRIGVGHIRLYLKEPVSTMSVIVAQTFGGNRRYGVVVERGPSLVERRRRRHGERFKTIELRIYRLTKGTLEDASFQVQVAAL